MQIEMLKKDRFSSTAALFAIPKNLTSAPKLLFAIKRTSTAIYKTHKN
jgi:hypothetical protein